MLDISRHSLNVSIADQHMQLLDKQDVVRSWMVSTAANGAGELMGSEMTPRGRHRIRAKIGAGCQANTVFVGRRPTGEIYSPALRQRHPTRDWILTRILWLCGMEPGRNRFGKLDTMRRFIYIHGCPDEDELGVPGSHGCIKMRNADVIELFDMVPNGLMLMIDE